MKALEFEEQTHVIAKDQKEYQPLPAYIDNGFVTYCMELDKDDVKSIKARGKISFRFLNFGGPFQPIRVQLDKPAFPVEPFGAFLCNPSKVEIAGELGREYYECFLNVPFNQKDRLKLKNEGNKIWITVATFNQGLQPISLTL